MTNDLALGIQELGGKIAAGKLSVRSVYEAAPLRIDRINPRIRALTDVLAASALQEVRNVEKKLAAGARLGKLAGIPIAIKDNIDTVPAICSAGLDFLADYRPRQDAEVVRLLRAEDAVIVGVAATDSGAFGVVTPAVVNPIYPERIAGGSSGGSAAAVAAGFCKAAIGTDTGGSIRIPAACCGIVGFKPTRGRVSAQGARPLAASADHVGPLARSIRDIRSIMEVIDPEFSTLPVPARPSPPVIGISRALFADAAAEVMLVIEEAILHCASLGCRIVDVAFPTPDDIIPSHLVLSLSEAVLFHMDAGTESLDAHPEIASEALLLGRSYSGVEHLRAIQSQRAFVERIGHAFAGIDFLMLPTLPVETPHRDVSSVRLGDTEITILEALIRYTAAFDQTGHPALSLPWHSSKLQVAGSIQFVGALNSDNRLLDFVTRFEQGGAAPVPPSIPFAIIHK